MIKTIRKFSAVIAALAALAGSFIYAAGNAEAALITDIVGRTAIASFGKMIDALAFPPTADAVEKMWVLRAPDGKAAFWWRSEAKENRIADAAVFFDAEPFVKAGLDIDQLPAGMKEVLEERGELMVGKKLSGGPLVYSGEITALSSFVQIVKLDRDCLGYHHALDHFGVTVAEGNVVEWAKDMSKNDKDLVFVLDPKVLIDAGTDPSKVEGWTYAKVPLEDAFGRKFEAEKFLKPFDLK